MNPTTQPSARLEKVSKFYDTAAQRVIALEEMSWEVSAGEAVAQADWLIRERGIHSLCVHGDNPQALDFVRGLREALGRRGIILRAFA